MIVVVGSVNLDLITTVERLPGPGETVSGGSFRTAPGGKGANQALAAARAGCPVRMVGAVGDDAFAEEALALLRAEGVDLGGIAVTHAATGVALIVVDAHGENTISVAPGANFSVLPGDMVKARLERGEVLVLQNEIPVAANVAALSAARSAGALSILNTAPFRRDAADCLAMADIVVANETEFDLYASALGLSGEDRAARMRDFSARTGRTVVVTLGAEGLLAASPEGLLAVPALAVEPVDTVGAGDTFCGYLAAGLGAGLGLEDALRRAAAAASLACLKPGAQPAIPHAEDVEAALQG